MNFITGISGFLGSYLAKQLIDNGEQVIGIKRSHTRMDLLENYVDKIIWYDADILDLPSHEIAMKEATKVYHCAAKIGFEENTRASMYKVNAEGTANIVNVALSYKIKKMIHVSSVAALPVPKENELIDENSEWSNNPYPSHYGKSKFMAEREAYRAMAEGIETIIVNPSTIIGAGHWTEGSGNFFENVNNGFPFYTDGSVGFIDVRDVVTCMIKLMNSDIKNDKFILSTENINFKKFFSTIAISLNKKVPTMKVSKTLGYIAIVVDKLQVIFSRRERMVTKETLILGNLKTAYSNEKIKKTIVHEFIPIEKSIEETSKLFLASKVANKSYNTFS